MAVITLLTDFGTADPYVGELRGVLLSGAPDATLADLSHEVPPGDVRAAAYLLDRAWRRFPSGTVHLVVVDPGVGTERSALALRAGGHAFVGPDNGVLSPALREGAEEIVALPIPTEASPTFHGRDVFAPAAAALATGRALASLGEAPSAPPVTLEEAEPVRVGDRVTGVVVAVDSFGNLVTNLGAEHVGAGARIHVAGFGEIPLHRTFGEVGPGALLAYRGSGGRLEVAVRDGSAAARLGVGVGAPVWVEGG